MPRLQAILPFLTTLWLTATLAAQAPVTADQMVRTMVANELASSDHPARWMFLSKKYEDGKVYLRQEIQTKGLGIGRLLAIDGKPLDSAARAKEDRRIAKLIGDKSALAKRREEQHKDKVKTQKMLQLLPDAFDYAIAGREGDLIHLTFKPDPDFDPPSREARVFHAMEGDLWIHEGQMRLAKISGTLMDDVNFGWGILGHLDKGGRFKVEQSEVAPEKWEMTSLLVDMHGRALLFATINTQERETMSHFERVPDELTVAKAAEMLMRSEYLARGN